MHPHCFRLDLRPDGARLYVLELSTAAGLALFDPDAPLRVSAFGAGAPEAGWLTAADLPPTPTVAALLALLEAHPAWDLVDVTVAIGARARLHTHDDGECHFTLASAHDALQIVGRLLPAPRAQQVIAALQQHPGAYVASPHGRIQIFASFEAYLAADTQRDS